MPRIRGATLVQPDGATAVWGVNSSSELSAHFGSDSLNAGEQIGYGTPVVKGMQSRRCSRVWLTVTDRDAALTEPGVSRSKVRSIVMFREFPRTAPRRRELYGQCSSNPGAMGDVRATALRPAGR